MEKLKPLIIAGPTASGKSSLALEWAAQQNGVIINGDSMQIYRELPILTAQPSQKDQQIAPHKLYGILDGDDACSVARWRTWVGDEIQTCQNQGKRPMIVGGTGLYLSSLLKGLSAVPDIDPDIRLKARELMAEVGPQDFHNLLAGIDPEVAQRLSNNDTQRILRAYEVIQSTGQSLLDWHKMPLEEEAIDCDLHLIDRPRKELHQRCRERFEQMLTTGAIEEVDALLARGYSADQPIMKALGVAEITAYLRGEVSLSEATERAVISTRQYIKRQSTWFRNQFSAQPI